VQDAHFLPFDTQFLPLPADNTDQAQAFKQQNAIVWGMERNNGVTPITEIVEGWYLKSDGTSGLLDNTTPYNGNFVPQGWSGNPGAYLTLVAPYCRSCHGALEPFRSWNMQDQFIQYAGGIQDRVCNKAVPGGTMPHSQRAYQKLWATGTPAVLAVDFGFAHCQFTPF
jgi:hypothetical protein